MNEVALSTMLLTWTLRVTCLLSLVWLATRVTKSAAHRHLVWTCGLAASLALPLLTQQLPMIGIPVKSMLGSQTPSEPVTLKATSIKQPVTTSPESQNVTPPRSTPAAQETRSAAIAPATSAETPVRVADQLVPRTPVEPQTDIPATPTFTWQSTCIAVWLTGCCIAATFALTGYLRLLLLTNCAEVLELAQIDDLRQTSGTNRAVRVVAAKQCVVPMTWGILKPTIAVPADCKEWPEEKLETVLLHELTHVARFDSVWLTLGLVVRSVLWFHPLAWLAVRELRRESEHAVDDRLLQDDAVVPSAYAELLTAFAARRHTVPGITMARASGFRSRLERVLSKDTYRDRPNQRTAILSASLIAAITLPIAVAQVAEPESQESAETTNSQEPSPTRPKFLANQPFEIPTDAELRLMTDRKADRASTRSISLQFRSQLNFRKNIEQALRHAGPNGYRQWANVKDYLDEFSVGVTPNQWFGFEIRPGSGTGSTNVPVSDLRDFRNALEVLGVESSRKREKNLYRVRDSFDGWMRVFNNGYATISTDIPEVAPDASDSGSDIHIEVTGGRPNQPATTLVMHFWREAAHWVPSEKNRTPFYRELVFIGLKAIERSYSESEGSSVRFDLADSGESSVVAIVTPTAGSKLEKTILTEPKESLFTNVSASPDSVFRASFAIALDAHRRQLMATALDITEREISRRYTNLTAAQEDAVHKLLAGITESISQTDSLSGYAELIGAPDVLTFIAATSGDPKPLETFLREGKLGEVFSVRESKTPTGKRFALAPVKGCELKPINIATTENAIWLAVGDRGSRLLTEKMTKARKGSTATSMDIQFRATPLLDSLRLTGRRRNWGDYPADGIHLRTPTSKDGNGQLTTSIHLGKDVTRLFGEWVAKWSNELLTVEFQPRVVEQQPEQLAVLDAVIGVFFKAAPWLE